MKRYLKVIILCVILVAVIVASVIGFIYYKGQKIQLSKEHYEKAEGLYAEENYAKAIEEYSLVHKWDTDNYELAAEKIDMCKIHQESLRYIELAKKSEEELDYEKAIETYNKVSEKDNRYYAEASKSKDGLQEFLETAEFILLHTKSIEEKFGLNNKDIDKIYYTKDSGYLGVSEVSVGYSGENDRLYIVSQEKPPYINDEVLKLYEIDNEQLPKYICILAALKKDTGWLSGSINSLREQTVQHIIENFGVFDTEADEKLLTYVQCHPRWCALLF